PMTRASRVHGSRVLSLLRQSDNGLSVPCRIVRAIGVAIPSQAVTSSRWPGAPGGLDYTDRSVRASRLHPSRAIHNLAMIQGNAASRSRITAANIDQSSVGRF